MTYFTRGLTFYANLTYFTGGLTLYIDGSGVGLEPRDKRHVTPRRVQVL